MFVPAVPCNGRSEYAPVPKQGKDVKRPVHIYTLRTRTPEEGFELAVKLSQKGVVVTQPSETIRDLLRPVYSTNADSLIAVSQVIAINFQTVAAANNYWHHHKTEE